MSYRNDRTMYADTIGRDDRERSAIRFSEGDKIEALYKGRGTKWFKGSISRVNHDGTYDIRYDDGDIDKDALASNIRLLENSSHRADSDAVDVDLKELRFQVQKAVDEGADLMQCFEFFDRDRSGDLDEDEFFSGLRRLGLRDVTRAEAREVMDKFPGRRRGHIKYADFVDGLKLRLHTQRRGGDDENRDAEVDPKLRDLRSQVVRAMDRGGGQSSVRECLERFDRDRSGDLSTQDLYEGLKKMGVELSRSEEDYVLENFPGRRRGTVGYESFIDKGLKLESSRRGGGRGSSNGRGGGGGGGGEDGVTLIASRLREQLWDWANAYSKGSSHGSTRSSLRKVFKAIDKGDTGSVTRSEMGALLVKKMKLRVEPKELEVLMDCIDVEGSGNISYDEFVDFACYQPEGNSKEIGVLHELISKEVKRSGRDLLQLFHRYDDRKRGVVSPEELRKVLKSAMGGSGSSLSSDDYSELLKRFCLGGGGHGSKAKEVDYDLLVLWVNSGSDLLKCEQRVRSSLQRFVTMGLDYKKMFTLLDVDGSGYLDGREFKTTMSRLGLMLTEGEVRALFHRYNTGGKGVMYSDFLELANDSLDSLQAMKLVPDPLREKVGDWVHKHGAGTLRKAFSKLDKQEKGVVNTRDFQKVVLKFKTLDLSASQLELLRKCFELGSSVSQQGVVEAAAGPGLVAYGLLLDFGMHQSEDSACAELHSTIAQASKRERRALGEAVAKQAEKEKGCSAHRGGSDGGGGALKLRSLEKVLDSKLRLELSKQDRRVLEKRLDPSAKGSIDGRYFLHWVDVGIAEDLLVAGLQHGGGGSPSRSSSRGRGEHRRFDDNYDNGGGMEKSPPSVALAEVLAGRGLTLLKEAGRDPGRAFRALDRRGVGVLSRRNFGEALGALGLPLGDHEIRALAAKHATTRRTSSSSSSREEEVVQYGAFVEVALAADPGRALFAFAADQSSSGGFGGGGGVGAGAAGGLLVSGELRGRLWDWFRSSEGGHGSTEKMLKVFRGEDQASNGRVTKSGFEKVTSSRLKMRLSKADVKVLAVALEMDGKGKGLRYGDFVEFVAYEPEGFAGGGGSGGGSSWGKLQAGILEGLELLLLGPSASSGRRQSGELKTNDYDDDGKENDDDDGGGGRGQRRRAGAAFSSSSAVRATPRQVLVPFQKYDPEGQGWVSSSVFRRVLEDDLLAEQGEKGGAGDRFRGGGASFSVMVVGPSEVRELVQRFDIGDDDKVRYGLFARWLCSGHKLQAVERKARAGLKALKAMGLNAEAPFLELSMSSSSSSKYCSVFDFCQAVASLGLLLTEGEVRALARAYGKDNGDEDDGRHYNSHGGEGGREGGRSSHVVAWRRFLDLEDGSSSLGGDQEGGEGGGDGSEFELSLRSVDGDVAALASKFRSKARQWSNRHPGKLAEIFASSLGPGTRGQHDNDGDDGSSGSDDDDGGGDSGSSSASESAEDSDDSSRKRSKSKTKKKKTKKKATKKKKKPSESLKKKSSESDGSRGLGAKGFRKLLQSLGLRTGDTSDEEALMGVFVNGGGDNDESSSSRKRHHRRLAVNVEVLGDFLFVPPGDDNEDEGPWFASDEDEDEDLEEDDDEYSAMVKQRRRGGRSQRRNRQGRSSSAKRLPGSAAVASGGDESDNHHALETVGASLRRHLRPKGSSTASANQLVWSTFAKAERKKRTRSLRSARSSWNSLTGALSRAAFSRAVGTLDPTLSRKDLAALERAFLVVTDNDRSDDDDDDRSGSSEDEDESGSENDGSRSDEEDGSESGSSNDEGSGGSSSEGSKGGGKQRGRGRGRARGSKSRSRSGRRARSGSAASRLFKGIMSKGSALTSSKRGGSSRSGRKKKKRSTRGGNGDDDVCWVHFACWLDAAIPMKVLLRVRNFVEANSTELRSKDLFAHLEDAAIAAAAAAGGDEDEDDDDDYDRHRRGSSRSPGRRGSGSGGGSSSSSSSKGKGLKLRFPVSLARALRRCGLPLSEPCAGALFTQLDRKAKGWVAVADAHAAFMGKGATLALEEAGGGGAAAGQRDGGGGEDWMEEWLLELRASLEDSFELIWQHFDGDHNGELDRDEMDDLCHQMIKAVDPRSEPTKHQVRDVKARIGAGGSSTGGGGRDGGRSRSKGRGGSGGGGSGGVDKETLRVGLVDYVEDEFRERLAQGNLTNGEATWQDMAGLFSAFDGNSDGCVSVAEFKYVLSHKMALLTVQEATALAACADANRDGSVSLGELKALVASAKLDTQLDGRDNGSGGRRRDSGRRTSRSRDRRSSSRDRGGGSSRRHSSSPSKSTTAKRMAATTTAYTSTNSATSRLAEYMSRRLTPLATSAVLKLKVGFVPRPEDYLSLAALGGNQGNTSLVSSVCRPSVLAKLDNFPKGKLGSAISGRQAMRRVSSETARAAVEKEARRLALSKSSSSATGLGDRSERLASILQFKRAEGVPCPDQNLLEGSSARGVRVCMFYAGDVGGGSSGGGGGGGSDLETIVGNQYKTLAETKGATGNSSSSSSSGAAAASPGAACVNWSFPDEPDNGVNDGRLLLSCDPLIVQEDMDLNHLPDLKKNLYVLIELTMLLKRKPRKKKKKKKNQLRRGKGDDDGDGAEEEKNDGSLRGGGERRTSSSKSRRTHHSRSRNKGKSKKKASSSSKHHRRGKGNDEKKSDDDDDDDDDDGGGGRGGRRTSESKEADDDDDDDSESDDGNKKSRRSKKEVASRSRSGKHGSRRSRKSASLSDDDSDFSASASSSSSSSSSFFSEHSQGSSSDAESFSDASSSSSEEGERSIGGSEDDDDDDDDDNRRGTKKTRAKKKGRGGSSPSSSSFSASKLPKGGGERGGQFETLEVTCGWVKVLLADLCAKERDLTFEVRHGNPWGTAPGEPIPEAELKLQQNSVRHQLMDAMPNTLGALVGKKRACTLTLRAIPVKQRAGWFGGGYGFKAVSEEVKVFSRQSLPSLLLGDVLFDLPHNVVLPVGGSGCSSLALFSTYCFALKASAEAKGSRGLGVTASPLLSLLPGMMNEPAMRASVLGMWARHYYARLVEFSSRLAGRGNAEVASRPNGAGAAGATTTTTANANAAAMGGRGGGGSRGGGASSSSSSGGGSGGGDYYNGCSTSGGDGGGGGGAPPSMGGVGSRYRSRLLEHLVPMLDDLIMDFWVVHKCAARFESNAGLSTSQQQQQQRLFQHQYVGSYSLLREDWPEASDDLALRIERVTEAYLARVLLRARQRRAGGALPPKASGTWYDEVVLPRGAIADLRPPLAAIRALRAPPPSRGRPAAPGTALVATPQPQVAAEGAFEEEELELHVPFNTAELKFGVGITKYGGAFDPAN